MLFNPDDGKPSNVTLLFSDLGLPTGPIRVRDLWAKKDLPPARGGRFVAVRVPPHGSMVVTVRAKPAADEL